MSVSPSPATSTGLFSRRPGRRRRARSPTASRASASCSPTPPACSTCPRGFDYAIVSEVGDPTTDGGVVPDRFDGTATFAAGRSTFLVRNHEQGRRSDVPVPAVAAPELTYDPAAGGGTTTIEIDRRGYLVDEYVSLAGTDTNCAGGLTPWGTWLTCEETEARAGSQRADQGPRLRLRGRPDAARAQRRPDAAAGARPVRPRGRRRSTRAPASSTSPRTPARPTASSTAACPTDPLRGHGSLRAGGRAAGDALHRRRHVRARPVGLQRARHGAAASGGSTCPTRSPRRPRPARSCPR